MTAFGFIFFNWELYYFLNQIYLNVTSGAMHGMFMFFTFFIYIELVLYNQQQGLFDA